MMLYLWNVEVNISVTKEGGICMAILFLLISVLTIGYALIESNGLLRYDVFCNLEC